MTDFQNLFTDRLRGKFAIRSLWNYRVKYLCLEIAYFYSKTCYQNFFMQQSVCQNWATLVWYLSILVSRSMCGGICHNDFIANLPLTLQLKEFWKSINIWRSYRQKYSWMFFWLTLYNAYKTTISLKSHKLQNCSESNNTVKRNCIITNKITFVKFVLDSWKLKFVTSCS